MKSRNHKLFYLLAYVRLLREEANLRSVKLALADHNLVSGDSKDAGIAPPDMNFFGFKRDRNFPLLRAERVIYRSLSQVSLDSAPGGHPFRFEKLDWHIDFCRSIQKLQKDLDSTFCIGPFLNDAYEAAEGPPGDSDFLSRPQLGPRLCDSVSIRLRDQEINNRVLDRRGDTVEADDPTYSWRPLRIRKFFRKKL
jgi:hypothetical protein